MRLKKLKFIGIALGMLITLTGCDVIKSFVKKDSTEAIETPIISEFNSENTNSEITQEENSNETVIKPSVRSSVEDGESEIPPVENQNLPENIEVLPEEKIEEENNNSIKPERRESNKKIEIERMP